MPDHGLIEKTVSYADARNAPDVPFETGIDGLSVARCRQATALEAMVYEPLVCLVLQGAKESYLGETPVRFRAGQSLIVSLDMPSASRVIEASAAKPYMALALRLDLSVLRELDLELADAGQDMASAPALAVGDADAALIQAMARLFDLVDNPLDRRILESSLKREVHFRLLLAGHAGLLRRLCRQDGHASRISRALLRIKQTFDEPLRVGELAALAGMSPSTFHQHFKALTATTPLQYQKDLRLLEAKRRLEGGESSVSQAAFAVGYESPSQFSREYARKFGASPVKHLATV